MTLLKLSWKRIKSQSDDYQLYIGSMIVAVLVYYSFMAMSQNPELVDRLKDSANIAATLKISGGLISFFLWVFMFTANRIFIKKRKKELALYGLLGMRKYQVVLMLAIESSLIGAVALSIGLVLGVIFSKLFSMILLKVLALPLELGMSLSVQAMYQTISMFVWSLVTVSLLSVVTIWRSKLIVLFKATQKGDRDKRITLVTVLKALIGIAFLTYSYYQASRLIVYMLELNDKTHSDAGFIFAALLILMYAVVGTYFFFSGTLPVVMTVLKGQKKVYYQGIRMVTLGNLSFNLRRNAFLLATIAVFTGTAFAAVGGAANVYEFGMNSAEAEGPVDYIVDQTDAKKLKELIKKQVPQVEIAERKMLIGVKGAKFKSTVFGDLSTYVGPVNIVSESEYQSVSEINPHMTHFSKLTSDEEVIFLPRNVTNYLEIQKQEVATIQLSGVSDELKVKRIGEDKIGGSRYSRYKLPTVIVTTRLFQRLSKEVSSKQVFLSLSGDFDEKELYKTVEEKFQFRKRVMTDTIGFDKTKNKVTGDVMESPWKNSDAQGTGSFMTRYNFMGSYPVLETNRQMFGQLVYQAVFLGLIFLIATGSIIMLKQLSEAEDEVARYQMLRKIGVSSSEIKRSIYSQNLVVFLAPVVIAYLHAKYALTALSFLIYGVTTRLTYFIFLGLGLIYFMFYIVTSKKYLSIVKKQ